MGVAEVREAMVARPRAAYLPPEVSARGDDDVPLAIGHGATCSQPSTVAEMLTLLDPQPGDLVLDVGSGSGWTTALLARVVGPSGMVVGVELEPALVDMGRENLARAGVDARIEQAVPGRVGWPDDAPFDRILVSAEAQEVPASLVAQLTPEGRMVIPVRGTMGVVRRHGDTFEMRTLGAYRFVPLREVGDP